MICGGSVFRAGRGEVEENRGLEATSTESIGGGGGSQVSFFYYLKSKQIKV